MPRRSLNDLGFQRPPMLNRRAAVTSAGATALTLALRRLTANAQDATPDVSMLPPAVAAYVAALETADGELIAATYAADAVLVEPAFGETLTGQAAIQEDNVTFYSAFSEITMTPTSAFGSGDHAAVEWSFAGTYSGQLPGLPAGAGQPVGLVGVDILQFTDDAITHNVSYFDAYGLLVQLGALPAPGGEASPEATPAM